MSDTQRTVYIAAVSGGKDSTAMSLHLREQGIEHRRVFYDTGWEHPATYEFLGYLSEQLGPIEVRSREPSLDDRREGYAAELEAMLGHRSAMVRWILARGMFPSRMRRFCTQELKVFTARDVMREAHGAGDLPVNVVGIRRAESVARSKLDERELSTTLDCMVWRPLIEWSERQVIDIHHRHGVRPNPLYLRGAARVGCWPCIQAGKAELRLLASDEPRIAVIERLEAIVAGLSKERHDARGEVLERPPAFFQGNRSHGVQNPDGSWSVPCIPIRRFIAWGQTVRGGKELDRQAALPGFNDGCLRWGMCDVPGSQA